MCGPSTAGCVSSWGATTPAIARCDTSTGSSPTYGTAALADVYFELKDRSSNLGAVDYGALIDGRPQVLVRNPEGSFQLFRIGDAVSSRNIHAAVYDALRLVKDL